MFLLLRAPTAGAPSDTDPAGIPAGPGAPSAPRGAQSHPQDGAGVWQARWSGCSAARGAGEESQTHQELGQCGNQTGGVKPLLSYGCVFASPTPKWKIVMLLFSILSFKSKTLPAFHLLWS